MEQQLQFDDLYVGDALLCPRVLYVGTRHQWESALRSAGYPETDSGDVGPFLDIHLRLPTADEQKNATPLFRR